MEEVILAKSLALAQLEQNKLGEGRECWIIKLSEIKNKKKLSWCFCLPFWLTEQSQWCFSVNKTNFPIKKNNWQYTTSYFCYCKQQLMLTCTSRVFFLQDYKENYATLISCDTQLFSIRLILSAFAGRIHKLFFHPYSSHKSKICPED